MRRRDFLIGAGAAALPFTCSPVWPADDSGLRIPLVALDGSDRMLALPQQEFDRVVRAAMYALTEATASAEEIAAGAVRLGRGEIELQGKNLIDRLDARIAQAKGVIGRVEEDIAIGRKLEGVVSRTANEAIWIAAAGARSAASAAGEIAGIVLDAATTERVARTAMLLIAEGAERLPQLGKVAADEQFRKIMPIDVTVSIGGIVARFPPTRRELVDNLLRIGLPALRANHQFAQDIFAKGIHGVLDGARRLQNEVSAGLGLGRPLGTFLRSPGYQSAVADMQAVGTLAAFVFGNVLGDRKTAEKIAAGMQFASVALKIGLAFASGGLGVIGVAGGLMSGLGALQGLFGGGGSETAATTAMLQQISAQVETLRREMHARFDRLEELEIKALNMLADIARELRATRLELSEKIAALHVEVAQLDRYVRSVDRHNQLANFNEQVTNARIAIGDRAHVVHNDVVKAMAGFLLYAIDRASHPAFTGAEQTGPLRDVLAKADRVDLTVGLLSRASARLGVNDVPGLTRNPIEWARGFNAFMELQATFPTIRNPEVDDLVGRAWSAGVQLRSQIRATITPQNIEKAVTTFERFVDAQGAKIANAIRLGVFRDRQRADNWDGYPLTAGSFLQAPPATTAGLSASLPAGSSHYAEARSFRGPFVRVDNDPLTLGVQAGRLKLVEQTTERFSEAMPLPGGGTATLWWRLTHYKLTDAAGRDLGPVARLKAELQNNVEAWDLQTRPDRRRQALWSQIGATPERCGVDYGNEIANFLRKPESLRDVLDVDQCDEMIAALVLYSAVADWAISDEPDDPWLSSGAVLLPRGIDDIKALLIDLTTGFSRRQLAVIAGGVDEALLRREIDRRHPLPVPPPPPTPGTPPWLVAEPHIVTPEPGTDPDGSADSRLTWEELHLGVHFDDMVRFTVDRWYQKGIATIRRLGRHLSAGASLPLIDRTLLKLNGMRLYQT